MSTPTHLCFVSVHVYPVLVKSKEIEFVGGAEVQQAVQMRALVQAGYRVSVLVKDYGQPDFLVHDGIEIYKIPAERKRGIKGLRFIYPRMTDVLRLLIKLSPDIVMVQTACEQVAAASLYARTYRKRFVYLGAADFDFLRGKLPLMPLRDTVLYRSGLRGAHGVIVQNVNQRETLRQNFGKGSVIIQNCYEEAEARPGRFDGNVLFAGTIKEIKQPLIFVELARAVPDRQFVMCGGAGVTPDAQAYYEMVKAKAEEVPNLRFVGYVPFAEIGAYFDGAALSVNTSVSEGLPNTFMQAWIRGVPTVSFVRPVSEKGESGTISCSDLDALIARVTQLTHDENEWRQESARCRRYFGSNHTVDVALESYRQVFNKVLS